MLTVKEVVECNRCCCSPALTLFFCSFYYQNTIFFTLHFVLSRLSRNFQPILSRVLFSIPHAVQEGLWGLGSLTLSLLFPFPSCTGTFVSQWTAKSSIINVRSFTESYSRP